MDYKLLCSSTPNKIYGISPPMYGMNCGVYMGYKKICCYIPNMIPGTSLFIYGMIYGYIWITEHNSVLPPMIKGQSSHINGMNYGVYLDYKSPPMIYGISSIYIWDELWVLLYGLKINTLSYPQSYIDNPHLYME